MLQEVTTGVDIIKRMIALGYLKETIDRKDKRQKLLQMTQKGKKVLQSIEKDFLGMPDVLGELAPANRKTLVNWLMSLDHYHENIINQSNATHSSHSK